MERRGGSRHSPRSPLCVSLSELAFFAPFPFSSIDTTQERPLVLPSWVSHLISFFCCCGCSHSNRKQMLIVFFFLILNCWIYKSSGKLFNFIQRRKVGTLWPRVLCLSGIARRSAPERWVCTPIIKWIRFNWAIGEIGGALTRVNTVIEKKRKGKKTAWSW